MSLKTGDSAPDFTLPDQEGNEITLSSLIGKNVVLYFYPKDDTPGCTKEACQFRDSFPDFQNVNAMVLGISADSVKSHKKFVDKYKLSFPLLSDESKNVINMYNVWKQKSMFGKKYMGIERTTYIIDKDGIIRSIFNKVRVPKHHKQVLSVLKELN